MNAQAIIDAARTQGLRIGIVETSAGGQIASALTACPGASQALEIALLPYSDAAKKTLLGVQQTTLDAFGAVSEDIAREMAEGLLARFPIDIALAETGITGPGGSAYKPEGRCCFALAFRQGTTQTESVDFGALGRARNQTVFAIHALDMLARHLNIAA